MSDLKTTSNSKKIALWAINPFEVETRPNRAAVEELKKWATRSGHQIQPVHVLYVSSIDAPPDDYSGWVRRFVPAVEVEVASFLRELDLPATLPPKVLLHHGGSVGAAVDALLQYADDIHASWILTSSKGRSGIRRLALGSFAESLLVKSALPVWVFGHGKPVESDAGRILFATDFSELSSAAFLRVVEQATLLKARITLFHCINLPDTVMSAAGAMGVSTAFPVDEYLRDQSQWARLRAEEWSKLAQSSGVETDFVIKEVIPNVANAIVLEAQLCRAGLIALASSSGQLGAALLGSHARQVIRQSACPVWVFGPHCPVGAVVESRGADGKARTAKVG